MYQFCFEGLRSDRFQDLGFLYHFRC